MFATCTNSKKKHGILAKRQWIVPGSILYNALHAIVCDKNLMKAIPYLVDFCHTGNLEVYHSVMLKYLPKRLQFSFQGMISRTQLSILHFNHVIKQEHAKTIDGDVPRYKLVFSKISQQYVVKPIKKKSEKTYDKELMSKVMSLCKDDEIVQLPPLPTVSVRDAPDKREAIAAKVSRFS